MITKTKEFKDEYIIIAIDSTGIKVTNRGSMDEREMEYKKERIFKNTCSGKCKEQENPFMKVTDEHVHDSKALPELVEKL